MCGLLDVYTATHKKPGGCSTFHQKVHTCTKLYGVTPMDANSFVHWCETSNVGYEIARAQLRI